MHKIRRLNIENVSDMMQTMPSNIETIKYHLSISKISKIGYKRRVCHSRIMLQSRSAGASNFPLSITLMVDVTQIKHFFRRLQNSRSSTKLMIIKLFLTSLLNI